MAGDATPTIYEWAGISPPALPMRRRAIVSQMESLTGHSLLSLIRGERDGWSREAVYVQSNNSMDLSPQGWSRSIRDSRYRYTRHLGGGGEQLFDLEADPHEQRNLVQEPLSTPTLDRMRDALVEAIATDTYPTSPIGLYQVGSW